MADKLLITNYKLQISHNMTHKSAYLYLYINEILKICRDRNEHLLIANVRVWHGTYIGSDRIGFL